MNMIYIVGWTAKDFEGSNPVKCCIKTKRNVGKTYDYFDVLAFKDVAEECKKIKKGSKISLEGTLQKSKFGETWYFTIIVNSITLLSKPTEDVMEDTPNTKKEELGKIVKDIVDLQNDQTIDETPNPVDSLDLPDDMSDDDLPF